MNRVESILSMLDYSLGTKKKRHIIGGVLMSVSLLFGSLAVTVISIRMEDVKNE